jgi:hypothetical protein
MNLFSHGPRKTRDYLAYRDLKVQGQVVESVMLPTMELLVLTFHQDGTYRVWLLDSSDITPVIEMEQGIPPHISEYALGYHASKLLSPAGPIELELERSKSW